MTSGFHGFNRSADNPPCQCGVSSIMMPVKKDGPTKVKFLLGGPRPILCQSMGTGTAQVAE